MKYISGDLETTGLNPDMHSVTEFAFVFDDLANPKPIASLPAITGFVAQEDMIWSLEAMIMFSDRLVEYKKAEKIRADNVIDRILSFLPAFFIPNFAERCKDATFSSLDELAKQKVTFAGKNFASFDKEFLRVLPNGDELMRVMHHRTLDVGTLYFDPKVDTEVPGTIKCMERAGIKGSCTHRALDDAIMVVKMIRKKFGLSTH